MRWHLVIVAAAAAAAAAAAPPPAAAPAAAPAPKPASLAAPKRKTAASTAGAGAAQTLSATTLSPPPLAPVVGPVSAQAQTLFATAEDLRRLPDYARDDARMLQLYEEAAALEHPVAYYALGNFSLHGDVVPQSDRKAFEHFSNSAALLYPRAHFMLGFMYATGRATGARDTPRAALHYTFAARGNVTEADLALGYRFQYGYGVDKSCSLAANHYRIAAGQIAADFDKPGMLGIFTERRRLEEEEAASSQSPIDEDDIIDYYDLLAERGDVSATVTLGHLHFHGAHGVERNAQRAFYFFSEAARLGSAVAHARLGDLHLRGAGTAQSNSSALQAYTKAADMGEPGGWTGMGYMYQHGYGVQTDLALAAMHYKSAADRGNGEAQMFLGLLHLEGKGVQRESSRANALINAGANHGHPRALYLLGAMTLYGVGNRANCMGSLSHFKNVVERSDYHQEPLRRGFAAYKDGKVDSALIYYELAAELGFEVAQSNAAWLLEGADQHSKALDLQLQSAMQGNVVAKLKLGDAYFYGRGAPVDLRRALDLYTEASQFRNAQAHYNIGYMHQHGLGVPQDFHLAKRHFDLAAQSSTDAVLPARLALVGLAAHFAWSLQLAHVGLGAEQLAALVLLAVLVGLLVALERTQREEERRQMEREERDRAHE